MDGRTYELSLESSKKKFYCNLLKEIFCVCLLLFIVELNYSHSDIHIYSNQWFYALKWASLNYK